MIFRGRFPVFLAAMSLCAHCQAAGAGLPDAHREVREHLVNLINIKTAQPEGNETEAARYIYRVLSREKIDWSIYAAVPERANLVAYLKGDGSEPPLLLISHLDTVDAEAKSWSVEPFKATLKDGYVYGRGASDCKDFAAINLGIMALLKRSGAKLKRDVIMLASADEESGGKLGMRWLIANHWDAIKAGFAINEGGGVLPGPDGKPQLVFVEIAEKMYLDVKLTARGISSHSSIPPKKHAIYSLAEAVAKVRSYKTPYRLNPVTRKFFRDIYPFQNEDAKTTLDMLFSGDEAKAAAAAQTISLDPFLNSQLRDTVTPTMIRGGFAPNVVPDEAWAVLNCRLLYDSDPDKFLAGLKETIADDNVSITVMEEPRLPFPGPMDMKDDLFRDITLVSSQTLHAPAIGGMISDTTDAEFLRRNGVVVYGLGGPSYETARVHGIDERISERELADKFDFIYNLVLRFAVK